MALIFHYKLNQEYITLYLCENRSIPENSCQGKCYLQKQLKKQEESNKTDSSFKLKEIQLLFIETDGYYFQSKQLDILSYFFYLLNPIAGYNKDIFHPPAF